MARVGGDEFVILLPETGREGSLAALTRIRDRLGDEMKKNGWPVTVSIGAVVFQTAPSTVEALIKPADELMYRVKSAGKDNLLVEEWPRPGNSFVA